MIVKIYDRFHTLQVRRTRLNSVIQLARHLPISLQTDTRRLHKVNFYAKRLLKVFLLTIKKRAAQLH